MDDDKTVDEHQLPTPAPLQPGETISPRQSAPPPAEQPELPPVAPAAAAPPTPPAEPAASPIAAAMESVAETPSAAADSATTQADGIISWTASEFIAHHKTGSWYASLMAGAVVVAAGVFFVTKDWVSTTVVVAAGAVLASYASRPPKQRMYQLADAGLMIDNKEYSFHEFRSFSVVPEGAFSSIIFMPLKRFGVQTTIYYDPQDEDPIIDIIGRHLPHEEHRADVVDRLMRRIRF